MTLHLFRLNKNEKVKSNHKYVCTINKLLLCAGELQDTKNWQTHETVQKNSI